MASTGMIEAPRADDLDALGTVELERGQFLSGLGRGVDVVRVLLGCLCQRHLRSVVPAVLRRAADDHNYGIDVACGAPPRNLGQQANGAENVDVECSHRRLARGGHKSDTGEMK